MAKELPRIAKSTEQTAFASEESYFVLETISKGIENILSGVNFLFASSLRQDYLLSQEIDETNQNEVILTNIHSTLESLVGKFDEFIETLKRTALRDTLNNDQTGEGAGGLVPTDGDGAGAGGEGNTIIAAFGGLGLIGKTLALAAGAVVGAISAYAKTVKFYVDGITKITKTVTNFSVRLVNLIPGVEDMFSALRSRFMGLVTGAVMRLTLIADSVRDMVSGIKNLNVFTRITEFLAPIGNILGEAVSSVKSLFTNITTTSSRITNAGKWMGKIVDAVKPLAKLFSKIFFPIGIIITAFDSIKGAIDGFLEGGILGGLEGAITGLFNSLIFGPLDMIKSAAAWILGFFGFDSAKEALNEFSFATLFTDIVGSIFDSLRSIKDWIIDKVAMLNPLNWFGGGDEAPEAPEAAAPELQSQLQEAETSRDADLSRAERERARGNEDRAQFFENRAELKQNRVDELSSQLDAANFSLVDVIMKPLNAAFEWVKGLFTFDDTSLSGIFSSLIDIVYAPVNLAVNWIKGLFGWGDQTEDFSLGKFVVDSFKKAKDWVVGLFTFDDTSISGVFSSLIDIVYAPVNLAVNWIKGLFGWGDPEESFSLGTLVTDAFKKAKDWVVGLFGWGDPEESFSIIDTVKGVFKSAKDWFTGLFSWGDPEESFSIMDTVRGVFNSAKDWFTGLFSWGNSDTPEVEGENAESFSISSLLGEAVDRVKEFFTNLFDFIPSFEEIKSSLLSVLPEWMRPESINEQRSRLEEQIQEQRQMIADGDNYNWRGKSRENIIQELENELASIPQASEGGLINAPKTGGLAMLHGAEYIAPLESPQGKILSLLNESFKESTAPATNMYSTVDRSGSMANVMNNTQRTIEEMRIPLQSQMAPVVNNYNVVQGGTNISAPSTSLAIMNPSRKGPGSRPDRR